MAKLSVITINYNDAAGLERTIHSVVSQVATDLEFIIIDGASTDNSIEVIKKYADKISFWGSEKDNGIYDAQNKGVQRASGDYVIFLNAGDSFFDELVTERFFDFIKKNPAKVIYGNTVIVNADGSSLRLTPPKKIDLNFWYANTLNHQALFIHRSLFDKYGNFNTQYRFAADFDLLFRIFVKEPSEFVHIDQYICHYDNTGLTSKDEYHKIILQERKKSMLSHITKNDFQRMRSVYLATLTFKKKYTIIISENALLKFILKPIYKLYQKIF